jgi:EAL domain-containing protein (putative c-di-GMP-specific phosphodiesterase class I)
LTRNRDVMALIHATLTLIENLGMASVAEGVEDAAQLAVLQSLGCRYAQGYHFSQPVPADQLLRASRPLVAVAGDGGAIIDAA